VRPTLFPTNISGPWLRQSWIVSATVGSSASTHRSLIGLSPQMTGRGDEKVVSLHNVQAQVFPSPEYMKGGLGSKLTSIESFDRARHASCRPRQTIARNTNTVHLLHPLDASRLSVCQALTTSSSWHRHLSPSAYWI
jgi:hypothetical protein